MGKKSDCQVRERRNIAMTDIVINIQGTKKSYQQVRGNRKKLPPSMW